MAKSANYSAWIAKVAFVFVTLFGTLARAQDSTMNSMTIGPVTIGEERVPINLNQIKVATDKPEYIVEGKFVEGSVQWVRLESVLLVPRARFQLTLDVNPTDLLIQYQGKTFVAQDKNGKSYIEIFVPLFFSNSIDILIKGKRASSIWFQVENNNQARKQIIDYSCSNVELQFSGMNNDYLTAGCYMARHGNFGAEKGTLEVFWAAPNYRLPDNSEPPYVISMQPNMPTRFTVLDRENKEIPVSVTAKIPERIQRLKTALGLGPYLLTSHQGDDATPGLIAPAIMLYGKFDLTDSTSLRFFEAYFLQETLFNNFGVYYAYDVGAAFDKRVLLSLNLGFQGVQYRHRNIGKSDNLIIFPQGLEVVYKHAFGFQNYNLVLGMFLPTSIQEDYRNYWVRYGKRTFWEWNYLSWRRDDRFVQAWGLSVGFPFITLF